MSGRDRELLLVDDDRDLCALMTEYFGEHGYRVESVNDGASALAKLSTSKPDLVLLDVMLPVLDGFEVLRQLRKRSSVPVIMLTARTMKTDRITGLNAGADDYLPKPFEPEELLARIRAVLRREGKTDPYENQTIECGSIMLDRRIRKVFVHGGPISVTALEFEILEYLVLCAGRLVSRDALAAILYQREATPYERAIDVHISHLRAKLKAAGEDLIHTVRGSGYIFSAGPGRRG